MVTLSHRNFGQFKLSSPLQTDFITEATTLHIIWSNSVMCGPVCILCLATVYETRKWPAQTPITSYDWLCRVRAFARKSAIQAPSKYTNALLCVPTDEETFAWTRDNE